MVACVAPLHAHRKASGRATPTRETPQKVCTAPCGSFTMQRMVTAPIPLYSPNDITRARSRAGGWIASFDFDGACTSTPPLPAIASPNESLDDSSTTTSTLTGAFCCNHQYSVTAITTSTGAVAERYAYTAYGQPTILNAAGTPLSPQTSTLNSRYSYTGREWDATLGLHHFRARWMSPSAGRFLGKDPMGYLDSDKIIDSSDVNSLLEFHQELYGFLRFNPLEGNDPSGLWELRCRRLAGWGNCNRGSGKVYCVPPPCAPKDSGVVILPWDVR
ncbi:MAG: RHS repeat domain-containing protein [Planctomycetota bacterium]